MSKLVGVFLPVVMVMAGIFGMSTRQRVPSAGFDVEVFAVTGHLVAYGVLAVALLIAFEQLGWQFRQAGICAFAGAMAYGLSDEIHQYFVPGRSADPIDLLVDAAGAAAALWVFIRVRESTGTSVRRRVLAESRRRS